MPTTKLFTESPILGTIAVAVPVIAYYTNYKILLAISLVILLFLIYFYRYYEHIERYPDNTIICPADGTITNLSIDNITGTIFISIFLSPMNIHTQVYPANAVVLDHTYDHTGKFDIVADAEKSRDNEKAIHHFRLPNGNIIQFTQIAGFLPRRISYDEAVNHTVQAGEYLGMIKFGSRVDLTIPINAQHDNSGKIREDQPNKTFQLASNVVLNKTITIGDPIGYYK